ncbi:site-specific integrase [Aurantiacibacter xanthus]|uniref:Site-specific integrase n=1 Tax=Aurantiacibacter xanthus TaxID=1784712 RepID=A0A3A1PA40_9SPHN|nr:site-specific integrase [Aurantiacibacter xanthus]RIV89588.1 site-specific integrase [Aurantiacibacter xanthus]
MWQVRKRWPLDCAPILRGEFIRSTGETDKEKAADKLPLIAAEYRAKVNEAREAAKANPERVLTEAEAHRMAAEFFNTQLPSFLPQRRLEAIDHRQLLRSTKERLEAVQAMLGRGDFGPVLAASRTLLRQAGVSVDQDSPAVGYLQRMLMRAFVELHRAAVARLEGDAAYTPRDAELIAPPAAPEAPEGKTVAELVEAYERAKTPGWSDSSKRVFGPVARLLREEFGDRMVDSIAREEAREFVELLQSLPTGMGRRLALRGLTAREAVAKGKELGIAPITAKTVNDGYLVHVVAVFNWAVTERWITSHSFHKLRVADPVDDADRRDPFTSEQLKTIFTQAPWDRPWDSGRDQPGRFWVPLLCLFQGLRLSEATQRRVSDVEEGEIPVIHIRTQEGARLKTESSRGTLPVHPELIRLGFLSFVAERKAAGDELLFPEEGSGRALSEWFSGHVQSLQLEGRRLGIHSFRHGFEDRLREAGLPERTALALARRGEKGSSRGYGYGNSIQSKAEALQRVVYPGLNLEHLAGGITKLLL